MAGCAAEIVNILLTNISGYRKIPQHKAAAIYREGIG